MRFNKLQDWLDWQETLHPVTIEMGLERVSQVWQRICPDGLAAAAINVAGTNGKGSCCAMLESIYRHAGYRVGCFTSPHLLHYNERIRIDGELATDHALCEAFEAVDQARDDISLTYFEFGTLAALYLFDRAGLDLVVLEVGLGGRLDAVNIIDADVALLTSVGLDHQEWLGHDRETIGLEKAGIFRPTHPAVCAEHNPPQSVLDYARAHDVPLYISGRDFNYQQEGDTWSWQAQSGAQRLSLPQPALRGHRQLGNGAAVLMVLALMAGHFPVSQAHLRQGLLELRVAGRFQVLPGAVPVILDVAHNAQAARVLGDNLRDYACPGRVFAVLGMLQDKDVAAMANALSAQVSQWYVGSIDQARGLSATQLAQRLEAFGIDDVVQQTDIVQAFVAAHQQARDEDCILVCGSFFSVADILRYLSQDVD